MVPSCVRFDFVGDGDRERVLSPSTSPYQPSVSPQPSTEELKYRYRNHLFTRGAPSTKAIRKSHGFASLAEGRIMASSTSAEASAVADIETLFTRLTSDLLKRKPLSITLPNRTSPSSTKFDPVNQVIRPASLPPPPASLSPVSGVALQLPIVVQDENDEDALDELAEAGIRLRRQGAKKLRRTLTFPSPVPRSGSKAKKPSNVARDFAITLRTLAIIHENLTSDQFRVGLSHHEPVLHDSQDNNRLSAPGQASASGPPDTRPITGDSSTPLAASTRTAARVVANNVAPIRRRITKREMFYRDPLLYGTQAAVDKSVDDIAAMMGRTRAELGVEAAGRGLVVGNVHWDSASYPPGQDDILGLETEERGSNSEQIRIVPSEGTALRIGDHLKWVLVVEKEATFRMIAQDGQLRALLQQGVMITGKGYPPLSVRSFLRTVADARPETPILGLMDFDPHGLDILLTYKFGSATQAHTNASLAVQRIQWFGLQSADIVHNQRTGVIGKSAAVDENGLLPLSSRDRSKALKMLSRPCLEQLPEWKAELRFMLVAGIKAELQAIAVQAGGNNSRGGIEHWLFRRLSTL